MQCSEDAMKLENLAFSLMNLDLDRDIFGMYRFVPSDITSLIYLSWQAKHSFNWYICEPTLQCLRAGSRWLLSIYLLRSLLLDTLSQRPILICIMLNDSIKIDRIHRMFIVWTPRIEYPSSFISTFKIPMLWPTTYSFDLSATFCLNGEFMNNALSRPACSTASVYAALFRSQSALKSGIHCDQRADGPVLTSGFCDL